MTVRLRAQLSDASLLYELAIEQHGLFHASGHSEETLQTLLNVQFPSILYNYLRECIDTLLVKAGYPALRIAPRNFTAMARASQAES